MNKKHFTSSRSKTKDEKQSSWLFDSSTTTPMFDITGRSVPFFPNASARADHNLYGNQSWNFTNLFGNYSWGDHDRIVQNQIASPRSYIASLMNKKTSDAERTRFLRDKRISDSLKFKLAAKNSSEWHAKNLEFLRMNGYNGSSSWEESWPELKDRM